VDVDALIDRLQGDLFLPLLLGLTAALAYLVLLAREHARARVLVSLAHACRRRIADEERLEERLGFSPRLDRLRRLDADLTRRLGR
jgi:hypothetical protein